MKIIRITLLALLFAHVVKGQTTQEIRTLIDNEQFNEASTLLLSLIAKDPANAVNYYYLADKLILQDRVDSALKMLDAGRRADTANPYIKIGTAKELLDRANVDEARVAAENDPSSVDLQNRYSEAQRNVAVAKALLEQAVSVTPPKTTQLLLEAAEAMIAYENKDLERAKSLLERVKKIDPKSIEAHLLFGDIYTVLNNGTLAAQYYNEALLLDPQSPRALVSKGNLYYRSTNYQGAKTEFEEVVRQFPNYTPAHRSLGDTYFKLGQLEQAKAEYKTYLEMSAGGCYARNRYAGFLYLSKDFKEAVNQCKLILPACDPTNPSPVRVLYISYYELKEYDLALEQSEKVFGMLKEDKLIAKDYEYLGKILVAKGQDSIGIEKLKIGFALDPSRVDLLSEMGNDYLKIDKYPEAISMFKQKVDAGKEVKSSDYYNLGRSYYYNNQFVEADSAFMRLNKNSPKYATGFLWRAKANTQLDSTSVNGLAKPHYEKYIELAIADSVNASKYLSGLSEAYGYLAYYHLIRFDADKKNTEEKQLALDALRKKALLQLDAAEAKNVQDAIKRLESQ